MAGHGRPAVERVQQVPAGAGRAQRQRPGGAGPAAMILARSLVFQLLFYGWTIVLAIVSLPTLLLPQPAIAAVSRFWSRSNFLFLRVVNGIDYRIEGAGHISRSPVIYASKHQSAWDTMIFPVLLHDPVVVL